MFVVNALAFLQYRGLVSKPFPFSDILFISCNMKSGCRLSQFYGKVAIANVHGSAQSQLEH